MNRPENCACLWQLVANGGLAQKCSAWSWRQSLNSWDIRGEEQGKGALSYQNQGVCNQYICSSCYGVPKLALAQCSRGGRLHLAGSRQGGPSWAPRLDHAARPQTAGPRAVLCVPAGSSSPPALPPYTPCTPATAVSSPILLNCTSETGAFLMKSWSISMDLIRHGSAMYLALVTFAMSPGTIPVYINVQVSTIGTGRTLHALLHVMYRTLSCLCAKRLVKRRLTRGRTAASCRR